MKKNALTILKNKEKSYKNNLNIIKNNNVLLYKENEYSVKLEIKGKKILLIRENDDIYSEYLFDMKKSNLNYLIKNHNLSTNIPIKTKDLIIKEDYILISYMIENDIFNYEIFIKEDIC